MTIREFCHQSKLKESAFYFWRKELLRRDTVQQRHRDHVRPTPPAAFVPVSVTAGAAEPVQEDAASRAGRIEILLPGGQRICMTAPVDRQALADVLAALRFDTFTIPSNAEGEAQPC